MKRIIYSALLIVVITIPGLAQEKAAETADKAKETKAEAKVFLFGGGNMADFLLAVKQQLGFDLERAATIDRSAYNLRIPKMKIPADEGWPGVLTGYNGLSERTDSYARLGRWIISPEPFKMNTRGQPEAIIFLPPNNMGETTGVKVKAFALDKLKNEDLGTFYETLAAEVTNLRGTGMGEFKGQVRYHESTGLLIASGDQDYVELATAIIEAFKETLSMRGRPPLPVTE